MNAYVIAEIEITDPAAYESYKARVPAVVAKYAGNYVVRGGKVESLEGGWMPKRIGMLEFPSLEQARKWYHSEDYAPLIELRQRASRGRVVLVEGVEKPVTKRGESMAAYLIGEIEVTDPGAYEDYRRQVLATVERYGGRFIVRGGKVEALEGGWSPSRIVVLEFPSLEQLRKWYDSKEYAPLIKLRQRASRGRLIAVEGV